MEMDRARADYLSGSAFWSEVPLAALEAIGTGTGMSWAVDCIVAMAETSEAGGKHRFSELTAELSEANAAADASKLLERGDFIWSEGTEPLQQAMSHLFAAKARLLQGNNGFYRYHLVTSMMFLGNEKHCRESAAAIPFALLGRYLKAKKRKGVRLGSHLT